MGKLTPGKPETDYPSIFLTLSDYQHQKSPKKRKTVLKTSTKGAHCEPEETELEDEEMEDLDQPGSDSSEPEEHLASIPFQVEQLTREFEVKLKTGIPSTEAFQSLFNYLCPKAGRCNTGEVHNKHKESQVTQDHPLKIMHPAWGLKADVVHQENLN